MATVSEILESVKERPAILKFYVDVVEDKPASLREGRFIGREVEMVEVTVPGNGGNNTIHKVKTWLAQLEIEVANGRLNPEWAALYRDGYARWKKGQSIPLNGTPVKGWGVISAKQQEELIRLDILTVEDLAGMTGDAQRLAGMGAIELKRKAAAWLAQMSDKGPLTQQMAALQQENDLLKGSVETLTQQVRGLLAQANQSSMPAPLLDTDRADSTAADIIDEDPPKRPRGNPNWVKKER